MKAPSKPFPAASASDTLPQNPAVAGDSSREAGGPREPFGGVPPAAMSFEDLQLTLK